MRRGDYRRRRQRLRRRAARAARRDTRSGGAVGAVAKSLMPERRTRFAAIALLLAVVFLSANAQAAAAVIGIGAGTPPDAIAIVADGAWISACGRTEALEYVARVGELAATSGADLWSVTRVASGDPGVARLQPVIARQFERRAREARL